MAPKKTAAKKSAKSSFMNNTIFVDVSGKNNVTRKGVSLGRKKSK